MKRTIVLGLAPLALLSACGGSSSSGGGAGDGADASGSYGTAEGGAPSAVAVSGAVVEVTGSPTSPISPLAGVEVCVDGHPDVPCVTSDATGAYSLPKVAPDADLAFSFSKSGYYGVVLLAHTLEASLRLPSATLSTEAQEAAFFQAAGWTYPAAGQGVLRVRAQSTGQTTCTGLDHLTLVASAGTGPVYEGPCVDTETAGPPSPALTATTTSGEGAFLVAPGAVSASSPSPTLLCTVSPFAGWGWASIQANSVGATILAQHETVVALQCK